MLFLGKRRLLNKMSKTVDITNLDKEKVRDRVHELEGLQKPLISYMSTMITLSVAILGLIVTAGIYRFLYLTNYKFQSFIAGLQYSMVSLLIIFWISTLLLMISYYDYEKKKEKNFDLLLNRRHRKGILRKIFKWR
jgi:hypothetical protein